jgi:hypothetical protein
MRTAVFYGDPCVESVNCETVSLTLSGTPADWVGKKARIRNRWVNSFKYHLWVYKGDPVLGSLVAYDGTPGQEQAVELDPTDPRIGTGPFSVRVGYTFASYRGTVSAIALPSPTPTISPSPPQGRLQNIATRVRAETGDNIPIAGFIIAGTDAKRVLIRGLGPSLAWVGIADPLQDPTLELYSSDGTLVVANDNWKDSQHADIAGTGLAPSDDRESAIITTLAPASYTAVLRGKNNTTGVSLVEVYDVSQSANSELANISTRGFVQTGENVVIGGFIPAGGATRVVVRGLGTSLNDDDVANPLQDPTLELRNADGELIAENDNWKDRQQAEIKGTGLAPERDEESAIVTTLPPAPATAILRGKAGTTGIGLVEVYKVE